MGLKIKLTNEERDILEGKKGKTLQKVMKSVVLYGEAFGAEKLVPLNGPVHMVTSFGITILKPVFEMMDELIEKGLLAELPFTADPRPLDYKNVPCSLPEKLVFKIMYGKQKQYEKQLKEVGLKNENAFTCTCYLNEVGNIPEKGNVLAWAESSAVVYANSVLGARTNRNSGIIELLSGIIGKTPYFGLLTETGRKAGWLVELKTASLPDAQVLGSAIGMKVMDGVPYITGLDKFLGSVKEQKTRDYLKDMGAASASNGAVGLYHAENITPEAVEAGRGLLAEGNELYVIDDAVIEEVIASYPVMWKDRSASPERCFIGCPHLSLAQIYEWLEAFKRELEGDRLKLRTILCAAPDVVKKFEKDTAAVNYLYGIRATITSICPLMYMNNPLCAKHAVITNSNKLRTYTTARYYTDRNILQLVTKGGRA